MTCHVICLVVHSNHSMINYYYYVSIIGMERMMNYCSFLTLAMSFKDFLANNHRNPTLKRRTSLEPARTSTPLSSPLVATNAS